MNDSQAAACTGKTRHTTKTDALIELRRILKRPYKHGGQLEAYRCDWCAGWHVGHGVKQPTPAAKQRRNDRNRSDR